MIISRTPLRASFVGGGTDMAAFYRRHGGAVISATIDRYVYVTVNRKFDDRLRVSYSRTEEVSAPHELAHPIVRAVLEKLEIHGGLEITSIADIPAHGTGLGSSSAFCVGLLNALHAYSGRYVGRYELGAEAAEVEIDRLKEPIGKQDQYASALGGLNYICFNPDDTVEVVPLSHLRSLVEDIQRSLLVLYTGVGRSASSILSVQRKNVEHNAQHQDTLREMLKLVEHLRCEFEKGNAGALGGALHESWMLKRTLASGISSETIDSWYERARAAGADGGKILGAGGGGFMLLVAPPERHDAIAAALPELRRINVSIERLGTTIVFSEFNDRK
jgi:D-glycero-alpha-D-manno-heptose-7-phosphate kinase